MLNPLLLAQRLCCCARENRCNGLIVLRLKRSDGVSRPEIGRDENLLMPVEIRYIEILREWRPHHQIERRGRKSIVALVGDNASPQHVDRARRLRKQFPTKR